MISESNLNRYRLFCAVAECESISRAAEMNYISQPAISKAIAKMEESLGTQLFIRNHRGVTLTEEGKIMYEQLKSAFDIIKTGEDTIRRINELGIGRLRLGTSSILAGACVKGLFEFLGTDITANELYNRVLCMEQIMSTGGGWQDQVGGLAPGIKMVSAPAGMVQQVSCETVNIPDETLADLQNRYCLIYTGQRRLARNLLREVVGKYIGANKAALDVLYQIQRIAILMRFELEHGNIDGFCRCLNEHWEQSLRLDKGCTNTCIDQIFHSVDLIPFLNFFLT